MKDNVITLDMGASATGYTFEGWSLTPNGAAVGATYTFTSGDEADGRALARVGEEEPGEDEDDGRAAGERPAPAPDAAR